MFKFQIPALTPESSVGPRQPVRERFGPKIIIINWAMKDEEEEEEEEECFYLFIFNTPSDGEPTISAVFPNSFHLSSGYFVSEFCKV